MSHPMTASGGTVHLAGAIVSGLFGGRDGDASGENGGGEVLIGGDYQEPMTRSTRSQTYLGSGHIHRASGDQRRPMAGRVIVWADEVRSSALVPSSATLVEPNRGDGGFVGGTSAKVEFTDNGHARRDSGKRPKAAIWLIDRTTSNRLRGKWQQQSHCWQVLLVDQ